MDNANYIEVDTKIIKENIKTILNKRKGYKYYIAVIKGNAYGHGYEIAKTITETDINYLAVATLNEAVEVRKYIDNNFPILCLQPIDIKDISDCLKYNVTVTVSDYNYYKKLIKINLSKKLKIQLKLNTGMNRVGLDRKEDIKKIYDDLIIDKKYKIELEGIYSHFSTLGIVDTVWDNQVKKFKELISLIDINKIKMIHMASSNSLSIHPKLEFCNAVRIGQLIFGNNFSNIPNNGLINKIKKIKRNYIRNRKHLSYLNEDFLIDVAPAFKLVSTIQSIKDVKKGSKVGYDGEYIAEDNIKVAMIPIGYTDGLNKNFTNKYVLINNKQYQIIGEINMCMTLIKVDEKVKLGDKVIIIGDSMTPKKVASSIGIHVPYLLCSFQNYIKRIYK